MKSIFVIAGITSVALAICFSLLICTVGTIYAQQPPNLSKVIQDKYTTKDADGVPYVRVVYESSNTTLLQGELIVSQFNTPDLMFNSDLWSAMDLLKNQYEFKVQHVINTGNCGKSYECVYFDVKITKVKKIGTELKSEVAAKGELD